MNKKKLVIGIIIFVLIYAILGIGIKIDKTGFHGVVHWGDELINIF
ncbi:MULTISPECIES: hypothetical protein [Paraclostridium]|nr:MULTISPECIES: hypothetical protein [Paraclostridium]MCU9813607.1 hypothetical protein [Paraclostridium sp. AKS81]